jgi:deoxyribonuclease (pyrimidine dimer)
VTRINCVPVTLLTGPHLVAEYRELPRVYALAWEALDRGENPCDHPDEYVLGPGHVRFFYSRLRYVRSRQVQLITEMQRRGYQPKFTKPHDIAPWPRGWRRGWEPPQTALEACWERLRARGGYG